jgi:hypothetical protein
MKVQTQVLKDDKGRKCWESGGGEHTPAPHRKWRYKEEKSQNTDDPLMFEWLDGEWMDGQHCASGVASRISCAVCCQ